MSSRIKPLVVAVTMVLASSSALAVDITGVHDLAVKNDPQLRAAQYRRDATAENRIQARSNLLPSLTASGTTTRGDSQNTISGTSDEGVPFKEKREKTDTDNENLRLNFTQTIYDRANYERLDIAKGQVSQG